MKPCVLVFLMAFTHQLVCGQQIEPGFSKDEFREILFITARTCALDSAYFKSIPEPGSYSRTYRSSATRLDNLWELWKSDDRAVISIRGTTDKAESWTANLYAAMVPAKGSLSIANGKSFDYTLATDERAAVHMGWLLSLAYMADDIVEHIQSLYGTGMRDFILTGHSQGGAVAYLLTAYLYQLRQAGALPADIRFKTYCSAAPKPGNLYFAYSYEHMTGNGLAFNVVNSADWVPETPVSIQTLQDFNRINPFIHARGMIKKMKFPRKMVMKHVYRKLSKPTLKAQRNYEKYLGKMTYKAVRGYLPDFKAPEYYHSNHYVRTGNMIVLMPDTAYYEKYPDDDPTRIFIHHFHEPYLLLLEDLK